jgi:hypothetical protein
LTGKAEGRKLPGRPTHRYKDNIKMDVKIEENVGPI